MMKKVRIEIGIIGKLESEIKNVGGAITSEIEVGCSRSLWNGLDALRVRYQVVLLPIHIDRLTVGNKTYSVRMQTFAKTHLDDSKSKYEIREI